MCFPIRGASFSSSEVVDYAFWKGILFVVIVLVAALINRLLVPGKSQD